MTTGIGWDSHRLAEGRPLILGGVTIPHERGLHGHSDAEDQRAPRHEAVRVPADARHRGHPIGSSRRSRLSKTASSVTPSSSSSASAWS